MRLAVVGSTKFHKDERAKDWAASYIQRVLNKYEPEVVISGGAIGIDQLAATLAAFEDIKVIEHLPFKPEWYYYKKRNILIAQDCTHLLAVKHYCSTTNGSGWTADYAESIGKTVKRIRYEI